MAKRKTSKKHGQKVAKKDWREFEKLVAQMERFLGPEGVKICSPDYIKDAVTGEMRQVDASLKLKVGSTEQTVIVECRRRSDVQDVCWIEQLVTKKHDLRAAGCIAVSSKGFSKRPGRT